jgi:hypothetical protein
MQKLYETYSPALKYKALSFAKSNQYITLTTYIEKSNNIYDLR